MAPSVSFVYTSFVFYAKILLNEALILLRTVLPPNKRKYYFYDFPMCIAIQNPSFLRSEGQPLQYN